MPYFLCRRSLNLLLCAVMLAGALIPPGVRHAHGGVGDPFAPHSHHAPDCLAEAVGHPHSGESDHGYPRHHGPLDVERPPAAIRCALDHAWHLHFTLLGFDFTLPESDPLPADEGQTDPRDLAIIRAPVDRRPTLPGGDPWGRLVESNFQTVRPDGVTTLQAVAQPPPPVTTHPLCDSARQERSGVLLA